MSDHDQFTVNAQASSGINTLWTASGAETGTLSMAIPPQFQGPGGAASPEDLYALAILNCFIATFKVIAEKSKFPFGEISGTATITSGKNEKGKLYIPTVAMKIHVTGINDEEKAKRLLGMAGDNCLIMNSVNTEKSVEYTFSA